MRKERFCETGRAWGRERGAGRRGWEGHAEGDRGASGWKQGCSWPGGRNGRGQRSGHPPGHWLGMGQSLCIQRPPSPLYANPKASGTFQLVPTELHGRGPGAEKEDGPGGRWEAHGQQSLQTLDPPVSETRSPRGRARSAGRRLPSGGVCSSMAG